MYSFPLKRCPLDKDLIAPLLRSFSADVVVDEEGDPVVRFDPSLEAGLVTERYSLLKEYLRAVRREDDLLHFSIDTEATDTVHHNVQGIMIESFGAFGSGEHGTTKGCIHLIERCLESVEEKKTIRFLDLGTGTGVLALRAYSHGIRDITAVDVSLRAVIASFHNFRINGITDRVHLVHGSEHSISGSFHIVTANIRTPILEELFDKIVKRTSAGGSIILSGIKEDEAERIVHMIGKKHFLTIEEEIALDGWISYLVRKGDHRGKVQ